MSLKIAIPMLTALLLVAPLASAMTICEHSVEFVSVSGPEDGLCTWKYHVCSGFSPAMSHWILESCVGTTNEQIEWWTEPELEGAIEYGYDPTTGITGLKFDVEMDDCQCADFYFKVKECTADEHEVGWKAGGDIYTGNYVDGPSHEPPAPEFPIVAVPAAVAGIALVLSFGVAGKR